MAGAAVTNKIAGAYGAIVLNFLTPAASPVYRKLNRKIQAPAEPIFDDMGLKAIANCARFKSIKVLITYICNLIL
jgi:hypothetical protein